MNYRSHKGQALVEFTLILPLLALMLFGIVEFGLLIYNQQVITNASREGARRGIVASIPRIPYTGANSIDAAVQNYAANLITFGTANNPVTTVTPAYQADAPFGSNLTVNVTYDYSFLLIPNFFGWADGILHLKATTVMRYE